MKFLLISPKNRTVYNFRGDLVKEIIKRGYDVVVTGPDQTDVEKIEALGAVFKEIPVDKTGTSVLGDLKYCRRLYKFIKAEKPDVTLGYTIKPVVYGSIAAHFAGIKNINSMITGGGYTFISKTFKAKVLGLIVRTLYKFGLSFSDNVIFQNKDDLNEFCDRKLVKRKKCSIVNGSGVNMNHFKPVSYPETISFFMLSRLLKSKGVCEYLEAAAIVKKKYPDVNFALLGKYEFEMQDAVEREEVEKYITADIIERYEETDDVRPYYAKCSVYVLPSYREGTPRTVLEAMAMKRAVITTDTQGCRETVIDGKTGFLVPVGDSASLAEKMEEYINEPSLIEEMGQRSFELAQEKYDVKIVNKKLLKIIGI